MKIREKPDLPVAFYKGRTDEFGRESGVLLPPEKIEFRIGGVQFQITINSTVAFHVIVGLEFETFCDSPK